MIADALLERGITDIRPKVVFSAAMPLSDRGRATRDGSLRCRAARRLRERPSWARSAGSVPSERGVCT